MSFWVMSESKQTSGKYCSVPKNSTDNYKLFLEVESELTFNFLFVRKKGSGSFRKERFMQSSNMANPQIKKM